MLEVNIFDIRFVEKCRAIAHNVALADNSVYVFEAGRAIGFRDKRIGTRQHDKGYFVPTRAKVAKKLVDELHGVSSQAALVDYVRSHFSAHVLDMTYRTTVADIWKNAHVFVTDDRVYISFPDADGTARLTSAEPKIRVAKKHKPLPITVLPELTNRLVSMCTATGIQVAYEQAVEILRRTYYQLPPLDDEDVVVYGLAIVLLLKNRIGINERH